MRRYPDSGYILTIGEENFQKSFNIKGILIMIPTICRPTYRLANSSTGHRNYIGSFNGRRCTTLDLHAVIDILKGQNGIDKNISTRNIIALDPKGLNFAIEITDFLSQQPENGHCKIPYTIPSHSITHAVLQKRFPTLHSTSIAELIGILAVVQFSNSKSFSIAKDLSIAKEIIGDVVELNRNERPSANFILNMLLKQFPGVNQGTIEKTVEKYAEIHDQHVSARALSGDKHKENSYEEDEHIRNVFRIARRQAYVVGDKKDGDVATVSKKL